MVSIFYAVIGVPLFLLYVSNIGRTSGWIEGKHYNKKKVN
jgi:hypothetical protein